MSHDVHPPCTNCNDPNHAAIECREGEDYCRTCGDQIQWDSDKLSCSCTIYEVTNK